MSTPSTRSLELQSPAIGISMDAHEAVDLANLTSLIGYPASADEIVDLARCLVSHPIIGERTGKELELRASMLEAGVALPGASYEAIRERACGWLAEAALRNIEQLFAPLDVVELRALPHDRRSGRVEVYHGRYGIPGERARMVELIERLNGLQHNLYMGINPRAGHMANRRHAANAGDVPSRSMLVLDFDNKTAPVTDPKFARTLTLVMQRLGPTAVVASGNGTHVYFRCVDSTDPADDTNQLNHAMAQLGADRIADLPRVIRLPNTVNVPPKHKREAGSVLALALMSPSPQDARQWNVADWVSAVDDVAAELHGLGIQPRTVSSPSSAPRNGSSSRVSAPNEGLVVDALHLIPNGDAFEFDRHYQLRVAHAVKGSVIGTPFDSGAVRDAFIAWSDQYHGADPTHDADLFDGIRQPHAGFEQLVELASIADPEWAQRAKNAMARERFASVPIEASQAAMIAAMPPVEDPGIPAWASAVNKRFAYVMGPDRVFEFDTVSGDIVDRHTPQAFCRYHDGRETLQSGTNKPTGLGTTWLKSPFARRYLNVGMWDVGAEPAEHFNVWQGLPPETAWPRVAAAGAGTAPLDAVVAFVRDVVASGRQDVADYVLNWMASKVQHPLEAPGTALALIGRQGTGKTTLAEMMIDIFGAKHSVTASNERQMTGNFNAHFENKLVAVFEEAFLGRDPRHAGPFKDLVTGARLHIEAKGRDVRDVDNRLAIILTSNDASVVPLEPNDRRTTLIKVSDARRQDAAYFVELRAAWVNGGREAFIAFLQARDISAFDVRQPLHTPEKAEALAETGDLVVRFWGDLLDGGVPVQPWNVNGPADWTSGTVFMSTKDLFEEFTHFARRVGARHVPSKREMDRRLGELCALRSSNETRPRVHGSNAQGERGREYPILADCRHEFNRAAGGRSG